MFTRTRIYHSSWGRSGSAAPALATLMVLAAGLVTGQDAPMRAEAFTATVVGQGLRVEPTPFPSTAVIYEDGQMELQSSIGVWHGQWAAHGTTFCLYFDQGPLTGETCAQIEQMADGNFKTSDGYTLVPMASALQL